MSGSAAFPLSHSPASPSPSLPAPAVVGGYPLVGALPGMLWDAPATLLEGARQHPGQLFSLRLGPVDLPIVSQPDHLHEVLVTNAEDYSKAGIWAVTKALVGSGLLTSDGDVWKRQRRLLQPLFTPRHVGGLSGLMVNAIAAQVDVLASRAGPVELGHEMTLLTQRVLMETMFGSSVDPAEAEQMGHHLNTAFRALNLRLFLFWLPSWVPRPGDAAFKASIAAIDAFLGRLVAERRANPSERSDMLSLLLAARDPDTGARMTDKQIRDQVVTMFVAGLDTTAVALTWMFWLLDEHPDVDARMRAELAAELGGRLPTLEDLPKLTYTRQVMQETMRLYPPAWIIPRYTPQGTTIGDHHIAAGTSLLVSPYLAHRDPAQWEDPDRFDPERFNADQSAKRHRMAYIPFGAGGRQCIGMHFAMMEGVFAAAVLAQRLRPRLVPGHKVQAAAMATLKPKYGMKMTMERV